MATPTHLYNINLMIAEKEIEANGEGALNSLVAAVEAEFKG